LRFSENIVAVVAYKMKSFRPILSLLALSQLLATALAINETEALYAHAVKLMSESPLIDTHVDLPQIIRGLGTFQRFSRLFILTYLARQPLDVIPDLATKLPGHVDIPKMRDGHLGGAFFTV
jgi:membrane dipeptidase